MVLRFVYHILGEYVLDLRYGYCRISINYLNHFAQSEIDSCDHAQLHLHHNNQYYMHLGALDHNDIFSYLSYVVKAQILLLRQCYPRIGFNTSIIGTYYARFVMDPSITKQCTLVSWYVLWQGIRFKHTIRVCSHIPLFYINAYTSG